MGKSTINGSFSIAMLNYQRVTETGFLNGEKPTVQWISLPTMKQGNGTCTVNGHFNGKISYYVWGIVHCPCNYQRVYMLNFPMLIFIGQLEVFRRTHMSCAMVKLEGTHMEHGRPNIMNGIPKFMGLWKPFWMGEMTIRFWANTQKHQKPYVLTMSQISDAFPIRIYVEVPISPKPCRSFP